jgi:hypothetical protein
MENFKQEKNISVDYKKLKTDLLSGASSPKEIHLKLLNADQSTPTHEAASENVSFLEDEEIKNFIHTQSREIQETYFRFLGFSQWHIAQNLMFEDKEQEGLELFKKSVANSISGNAEDQWIAYGQGTIAYLESDIVALRSALAVETILPKNKVILERMLARLEKGEKQDYKLDYS